MVALEDELVIRQPCGVGQTGVYYAQRQVMEAVVDKGDREEL